MRKLVTLAVLLVATAPAAAATAGPATNDAATFASKRCTALRATIGLAPFAQTFASFGACVSSVTPLELANRTVAAASCRRAGPAFDSCVALNMQISSAAEALGAGITKACGNLPKGSDAFGT